LADTLAHGLPGEREGQKRQGSRQPREREMPRTYRGNAEDQRRTWARTRASRKVESGWRKLNQWFAIVETVRPGWGRGRYGGGESSGRHRAECGCNTPRSATDRRRT